MGLNQFLYEKLILRLGKEKQSLSRDYKVIPWATQRLCFSIFQALCTSREQHSRLLLFTANINFIKERKDKINICMSEKIGLECWFLISARTCERHLNSNSNVKIICAHDR